MNVKGIEDYMLDLKVIFAEYDIMTVGKLVAFQVKKRWNGPMMRAI